MFEGAARWLEEASDVYTITVVLFLIPIWILVFAWRCEFGDEYEFAQRNWRSHSLRLALFFATIATESKTLQARLAIGLGISAPHFSGWR
jgi:hypothetical protein